MSLRTHRGSDSSSGGGGGGNTSRGTSRLLQSFRHQKLYGREKEIARLRAALQRAKQVPKSDQDSGKEEDVDEEESTVTLFLVEGVSGVGKTALIETAFWKNLPQVQNKHCLLGCGKFERTPDPTPYGFLFQAIRQIVQAMLQCDSSDREMYANVIQTAFGPDEMTKLVGFIPELNSLVQGESSATTSAVVEGKNLRVSMKNLRFSYARRYAKDEVAQLKYLIRTFLKKTSLPQRPIVLYRDDVQWIDDLTMGVVQAALKDNELNHIVFVAAFRTDEAYASAGGARNLQMICDCRMIELTLNYGIGASSAAAFAYFGNNVCSEYFDEIRLCGRAVDIAMQLLSKYPTNMSECYVRFSTALSYTSTMETKLPPPRDENVEVVVVEEGEGRETVPDSDNNDACTGFKSDAFGGDPRDVNSLPVVARMLVPLSLRTATPRVLVSWWACVVLWLYCVTGDGAVASTTSSLASSSGTTNPVYVWEEEIPTVAPIAETSSFNIGKQIRHRKLISTKKEQTIFRSPLEALFGRGPLSLPNTPPPPLPHPLRTDHWQIRVCWRGRKWRKDTSTTTPTTNKQLLELEFSDNGYMRCCCWPNKTKYLSDNDKGPNHSNSTAVIGKWALSSHDLTFKLPVSLAGQHCSLRLAFHGDFVLNPFGKQPKLIRGVILQDNDTADATTLSPKRWFRPVLGTFTGEGIGKDTADFSYHHRKSSL